MPDIAEILHNIADHTETLYRFLSEPAIADDIKGRLIDHIVLEEKENTVALQELHNVNPTALTQKMLDHSFVLQRVMNDYTMPLDLKQELLHHFIEEHQEWQTMVLGTPTGHAEEPGSAESIPSRPALQTAPDGIEYGTRGNYGVTEGKSLSAEHSSHGGHSSHSGKGHGDQSKSNQQTETREWTVGPLWNQGG